jgi:two-component sensor histidine kinase
LDEEDIMTQLSSQQSLPQEGILLHELNHRINNEFAAAISVVSLAAARSGNNEVKAALLGSCGTAAPVCRRPSCSAGAGT